MQIKTTMKSTIRQISEWKKLRNPIKRRIGKNVAQREFSFWKEFWLPTMW